MSTRASCFTVQETVAGLRESLRFLEWVAAQVPVEWHHRPPFGVVRGIAGDERTVAQHIAHLTLYEKLLANPVLNELSLGRDGTAVASSGRVSWMKPLIAELAQEPLNSIFTRLHEERAQQISIVERFDNAALNRRLTQIWSTGTGHRLESAGWVANKTTQHTGEHTNTVFRFALFHPDEYDDS